MASHSFTAGHKEKVSINPDSIYTILYDMYHVVLYIRAFLLAFVLLVIHPLLYLS